MEAENKSPNRLWRESGTSLSFADWIQREKEKGAFLANKKFENFASVDGGIDYMSWLDKVKEKNRLDLGIDKIDNPNKKDNTVLGLSKPILIISGLLIIGAIGYRIYQNKK